VKSIFQKDKDKEKDSEKGTGASLDLHLDHASLGRSSSSTISAALTNESPRSTNYAMFYGTKRGTSWVPNPPFPFCFVFHFLLIFCFISQAQASYWS
jgi:hypothetical protein